MVARFCVSNRTVEKVWGDSNMEQMYSLNYMLKLIKSFCDNKTSDYMFIKHYNTLSLPESEVEKIVDETEEEYCLLLYTPPHSLSFLPICLNVYMNISSSNRI